MKTEEARFSASEWIIFILSTVAIFLSAIILLISALILFSGRQILLLISRIKTKPLQSAGIILGVLFLIIVIYWFMIPVDWKSQTASISIFIDEGESLNAVISKLNDKGVEFNHSFFALISKLSGVDRHLHVGKYDFQKGVTPYSILRKLAKGEVSLFEVTIPEGLSYREIAGILERKVGVDSLEFTRKCADITFIKDLNFDIKNLEGYLFPNTYNLYWGMEPEKIIRLMVEELNQELVDSLRKIVSEIGFTLFDMITFASLVESEAKIAEERPLISAVYHNRLKRGMLLQCDPTVIYALSPLNRPLVLKDLEFDSPYNTYIYPGLPPGPINNPGKASILATLFPANVDYLYFVARGDGSHIFSSTLEKHNEAIREIKKNKEKG
ncbi:MAG: endolytic transglycosylase MltG [Candidatus Zixiibacteriota bacterium]